MTLKKFLLFILLSQTFLIDKVLALISYLPQVLDGTMPWSEYSWGIRAALITLIPTLFYVGIFKALEHYSQRLLCVLRR